MDRDCTRRDHTHIFLPRNNFCHTFLVACTRLYNPLCPSVDRSVGRLVCHTLLFFMILSFRPHCSCPNGLVISNMAPAHPHATSVAVYPALFQVQRVFPNEQASISSGWRDKGPAFEAPARFMMQVPATVSGMWTAVNNRPAFLDTKDEKTEILRLPG